MGRYRFVVNKGEYSIEILNNGIAIENYVGLDSIVVEDNTIIAKDIVVGLLKMEKMRNWRG